MIISSVTLSMVSILPDISSGLYVSVASGCHHWYFGDWVQSFYHRERPDRFIRRRSQAWACYRYVLPAKIPFSRIEILYLLTSEQALLQVYVLSAQISAGSVSLPQMVQRRLPSDPFLARRENLDGLVGFIDFLPDVILLDLSASRRTGDGTIGEYPMCLFSVSADRTLVRESGNNLGELDSCHDVHFFLLENGDGWRRR